MHTTDRATKSGSLAIDRHHDAWHRRRALRDSRAIVQQEAMLKRVSIIAIRHESHRILHEYPEVFPRGMKHPTGRTR